MTQQAKLIMALLVAGSITVIISIFVSIYLRAGFQRVEIVAVPKDATITASFGRVKHGTEHIPYGEHTFTIKRDGFKTLEKQVTITKQTRQLAISTIPENETGEKYLEENPEEERVYDSLGYTESQRIGQEVQSNYPFIRDLPKTNFEDKYTIHYGVDESTQNYAFFVIGTSSTNGRKKAIDWLQESGVDITKADIRYGDFKSPLIEERTVEGFNS